MSDAAVRDEVVAAAVEWFEAREAVATGIVGTRPPDMYLVERYSEATTELLAVVSQNRAALADPMTPSDPTRETLDVELRTLLDTLEAETHLPPKPTQYRRGWADAHARAAGLVRMHRFARGGRNTP